MGSLWIKTIYYIYFTHIIAMIYTDNINVIGMFLIILAILARASEYADLSPNRL